MKNETHNLTEWSKILGVQISTLSDWIKRNYSEKEIFRRAELKIDNKENKIYDIEVNENDLKELWGKWVFVGKRKTKQISRTGLWGHWVYSKE